jgi:DNA-binding transcriptional regulator GbsR (MarR family)
MVRKVGVPQSRRDYYEANTDLWSIATAVVGRRIEDEARSLLTALEGDDGILGAERTARINSMRVFLQMAISMVEAFRRGEIMNTQALQKLVG